MIVQCNSVGPTSDVYGMNIESEGAVGIWVDIGVGIGCWIDNKIGCSINFSFDI